MGSRKHRRRQKQQQPATPPPKAPDPTPPKAPTGRQTLLTPDIHAALVAAARSGTPVGFLGPLAGVHRATVFEWLRKGAKPNTPYTAFHDAIKAAQSAFVGDCLVEIARQGNDAWQAKAWLLERMFREEFASNQLEINQIKKEVKDLKQLLAKVPRDAGEEAAEGSGASEGGSDPSAEPAAPPGPP